MNIPKLCRSMMVTMRPTEPNEEPSLERDFQHEARNQNEMQRDKTRVVKAVVAKIKEVKGHLKLARKDARRLLEKQLEVLEQEQFQLLRNEILNMVKSSAGLIDYDLLKKVPGSKNEFKNQKHKIEKEK